MTNYLQTLMHLIKGILGAGIFSMGVAFKEAGMIVALMITPVMGVIVCHCASLLVRVAEYVELQDQEQQKKDTNITDSLQTGQYSYAEITELVFKRSSVLKNSTAANKLAKYMKLFIVVGLCTMNLGFCCTYVVFLGTNMTKVLAYFDINVDIHLIMLISILPMWFLSLITKLEILAPFSMFANVLLGSIIVATLYFVCQDLPHITSSKYVGDLGSIPVFLGIALYTYECIALIIPLRNAMKDPKKMIGTFGVLNVGFLLITPFVILMGSLTYLKYGEKISGTVFINLPETTEVEVIVMLVCLQVILTYPVQMYIPVTIIWPLITNRFGPFKRPVISELYFRTCLVGFTLVIGQLIPFIHLIMSLVGAICSTSLTLFLPAVMDMILFYPKENFWLKKVLKLLKNGFLVILAVGVFIFGIYSTIRDIIIEFKST